MSSAGPLKQDPAHFRPKAQYPSAQSPTPGVLVLAPQVMLDRRIKDQSQQLQRMMRGRDLCTGLATSVAQRNLHAASITGILPRAAYQFQACCNRRARCTSPTRSLSGTASSCRSCELRCAQMLLLQGTRAIFFLDAGSARMKFLSSDHSSASQPARLLLIQAPKKR